MQGPESEAFDLAPTANQLRRWGLDPAWSRRVAFTLANGTSVSWHVLDTGPAPLGTIVCVHGNPSWGYLWRDVLQTLSPDWRIIAVDQTGMGYSERTGPRRLADRVDELVRFCQQEVDGPLVLAAHDWGGPIAVGAAGVLDTRALVLANTAVAKPHDVPVPPLISAVRTLTALICKRTPVFVDGAAAMTKKTHREALRAPYRSAARRGAVADFVNDIPVRPGDPSWASLAGSASTLSSLDCPILILWGGRDPVFHDRYLRDLRRRVPHAHVERFADAGHYVCLDKPVGSVIDAWLTDVLFEHGRHVDGPVGSTVDGRGEAVESFRSVLATLGERSSDPSPIYKGPDATMTWKELAARSTVAASALRRQGVRPGERVCILIPPRAELLVAAIATWKVGGVAVVADASAGLVQLRRLIRGAAPMHVIGTPATLGAARLGRFAPGALLAAFASLPGVTDLRVPTKAEPFAAVPLERDDLAAVVHTSGATGSAKPVRYTHRALAAQRDALADLWSIQPDEAFTTSFGSFMLLAPVIGMGFVRPDFDVNRPSELDFDRLCASLERAPVTTAWLSPASARAVVATSAGRRLPLHLVMLAGAPIPRQLVRDMQAISNGEVRTPYGMTECLPVTDGADPLATGALGGTSTGRPLPGSLVTVVALDEPHGPALEGAWGEILVSAPWMFDGYDARWSADSTSIVHRDGLRFHRTGDVGYLSEGLVFQLGRVQHVLRTATGPFACASVEEPIAAALGRDVAAVAVGPPGTAVVAVVISDDGQLRVAPASLAANVRNASSHTIAAVLLGRLPTDRRHESKVDRNRLGASVERLLAGR